MRAVVLLLGWLLVSSGVESRGAESDIQPASSPSGHAMAADTSTSGIEGRVTIRPVRSVERRGVSNEQPYQARITVLDSHGREVTTVDTDPDGRYRVMLPPGAYVLRPESPGLYPRASQQRVVVPRNALARIDIVYDSGMR